MITTVCIGPLLNEWDWETQICYFFSLKLARVIHTLTYQTTWSFHLKRKPMQIKSVCSDTKLFAVILMHFWTSLLSERSNRETGKGSFPAICRSRQMLCSLSRPLIFHWLSYIWSNTPFPYWTLLWKLLMPFWWQNSAVSEDKCFLKGQIFTLITPIW